MRAYAVILLAAAFVPGCAAFSPFPVASTGGPAPECGSEPHPIAAKQNGRDAAIPSAGTTSPSLLATMKDEVSQVPASLPAKPQTTGGPPPPNKPQLATTLPAPDADLTPTTLSPAPRVDKIVPMPATSVATQVKQPVPAVVAATVSPSAAPPTPTTKSSITPTATEDPAPAKAQFDHGNDRAEGSIKATSNAAPTDPEPVRPADEALTPRITPALPSETRPASPPGQPVARVGDEIIALPDLTKAVKAQLAQLPPGGPPSRRQIITLARATLKAMIIRSLVLQEARDVMGGQRSVEEATRRIEKKWNQEELPSLINREGVADLDNLRAKLATRSTSPETLHDEFVVRSMALELMERDGSARDLDSYLTALRRRRPVTSIMSASELAAAGKQAVIDESLAR